MRCMGPRHSVDGKFDGRQRQPGTRTIVQGAAQPLQCRALGIVVVDATIDGTIAMAPADIQRQILLGNHHLASLAAEPARAPGRLGLPGEHAGKRGRGTGKFHQQPYRLVAGAEPMVPFVAALEAHPGRVEQAKQAIEFLLEVARPISGMAAEAGVAHPVLQWRLTGEVQADGAADD